ncbi:hypothetical protein WCLP8_2120009 [uncultured Gammaproteobacteria bacterium]
MRGILPSAAVIAMASVIPPQRDVIKAAARLVRLYGHEAADEAEQRVVDRTEIGDRSGATHWKSIAMAVQIMLKRQARLSLL